MKVFIVYSTMPSLSLAVLGLVSAYLFLTKVANALGVDDSRFALMPVTWTKGQDRRVLTIEVT